MSETVRRKKQWRSWQSYLLFPVVIGALSVVLARAGIAPVMVLEEQSRSILRTSPLRGRADRACHAICAAEPKYARPMQRSDPSLERQEVTLLVFGQAYCASIAIFALVLFLVGDPLRHAIFGATVSFVGVAAWSYYVLRPKHRIGNQ